MFLSPYRQNPMFLFDADEGSGGQPGADSVTPTPQPPPDPTPPPERVNWEERFKGQQRVAAKLQAELEAAKKAHKDAITAYESQITTLTHERDTALSARAQAEQAIAQKDSELANLQKQLTVVNKILATPELAPLLPLQAKGLLAVGNLDGEALDTYLTEMAEALSNMKTEALTTVVSGSTPTPPSGPRQQAGMTEEQLYDLLMTIPPSDPKYAEYKRAYSAMLANKQE